MDEQLTCFLSGVSNVKGSLFVGHHHHHHHHTWMIQWLVRDPWLARVFFQIETTASDLRKNKRRSTTAGGLK